MPDGHAVISRSALAATDVPPALRVVVTRPRLSIFRLPLHGRLIGWTTARADPCASGSGKGSAGIGEG
jgi:hypothetical protein